MAPTPAEIQPPTDAQLRYRPPLFSLGRMLITPAAKEALLATPEAGDELIKLIAKHVTGNWGELDAEDWLENDYAVPRQLRILSAYTLADTKIWIITEADRSATTILTPHEY